jgi:hypothetical protein
MFALPGFALDNFSRDDYDESTTPIRAKADSIDIAAYFDTAAVTVISTSTSGAPISH